MNAHFKKWFIALFASLFITATIISCQSDFFENGQEQIGNALRLNTPNILLVVADDLGLDATPGYPEGKVKAKMPTLENMQDNGITFDNFCSYANCSATRSSILTGKHAYKTGINRVLNADVGSEHVTVFDLLKSKTVKTYATAIIGKWHASPDYLGPNVNGVDYYAGLLHGQSDYFTWNAVVNGFEYKSNTYITSAFTNWAIDWINQQNEPWFCWLAYTAPHIPFHAPPDSMHSQGKLSNDSATIANNKLKYCIAMVESLDHEFGRLLKNIPKEVLDNTVIIFIGDNGSFRQVAQSPYSSSKAKSSPYQGGINVPLVVSGYGVTRKNVLDTAMLNSTDLYCTIAELGGVNIKTAYDSNSISFKHLLSSASKSNRTLNYAELENNKYFTYTLRNQRYKYIYFNSQPDEFYDLMLDPYENNNLLINTTLTGQQTVNLNFLKKKVNNMRKN
jgi:arylsulfatase A-like enzyme